MHFKHAYNYGFKTSCINMIKLTGIIWFLSNKNMNDVHLKTDDWRCFKIYFEVKFLILLERMDMSENGQHTNAS